jgi:hypothetical protein
MWFVEKMALMLHSDISTKCKQNELEQLLSKQLIIAVFFKNIFI